ncbi:MAG: hypothetical protein LBH45_04765 [Campylobacteraceae bacterium]|nr:hypothetical protein [Campylobacteraceae bacterium]
MQPLVERGKLCLTIPSYASNTQRYVNAENAGLIPTEETILDFCKELRTRTEIAKYFGLSLFMARKHYDPLIESGKLVGDTPESPRSKWQKFIAADIGVDISKTARILEFCQIPKTRNEIAELLGINHKYLRRYTASLIECGKLRMTKPESVQSIDQKYVASNVEAIILSAETIRAFCITPKSRKEIAEYFGLKRQLVQQCINKYVAAGILKRTMPINPICKQQRFVDSAIEIELFTEEALLEFCKTPRSKDELYRRFSISTKCAVGNFIYPLIEKGKLKRTIPEYKHHKYQRFYSE